MPFPILPSNSSAAYFLNKSLRFRSSASATLSRTPASASNRKIWTFSAWIKRGNLGTYPQILTANYPTVSWFVLGFGNDETLQIAQTAGSSASWRTSAVFRDFSAWYHVVLVVDTTSATSTMNGSSTDRFRLYVNNVQYVITGGTIPSQNADLQINNNVSHTIGGYSGEYFDGYMAEINFVDGQALTPSSFGSTNATTGVWQPAKYSGTYGTNGYYLPFTNTGATVSANYLVVAGGGGGGQYCGGGGAGGLLSGTTTLQQIASYSITVGAGGAGSTSQTARGTNGSDSVFGTITSTGGGGGGSVTPSTGASGGSGGGGGAGNGAGGAGTSGQGNNGGAGKTDALTYTSGGGGGGASAVGGNGGNAGQAAGAGGAGTASSISGSSVTYAGGGGAGFTGNASVGAGGSGGGGAGGGNNGTANTGGGGGGGNNSTGGTGGSGIVIVSYAGSAVFTGGTVTSSGGNTIHTFTSSGTLSPIYGIANDYSGNGNNWTPNNISLTTGTTYDSMNDVPTLTSATVANYAVINPLNTGGGTYSNGNLQWVSPATDLKSAQSTIALNTASTGKWYWEVTCVSKTGTNYQVMLTSSSTSYNTNPWLQYRSSDGVVTINGSSVGTFSTFTTGDVIGVTFDASNSQVALYKNNTLVTTQTISNTSNTYIYAALGSDSSGGTMTYAMNFGQQPFTYTPPTGFVALNTYNLPDSTIVKGNTVMDATTYTGTSSAQSITNSGSMQPDMVWCKSRSGAYDHGINDVVRGAGNTLLPNTTNVEQAWSAYFTAFNSNGFSVASNGGTFNLSGTTYVGWQWQAGKGSSSTNTNGSITTTVSVNATAGFSVVTYTGSGAAGTVGHGLGVTPAMIITKKRTNAGGGSAATSWVVWHKSLPSATSNPTGYIYLNFTNAASTTSNFYDGTAINSSTFRWLTGNDNINYSNDTFVSYCWSEIAGFSKFGSYTGNGSSDGPFVYTGFRPKFIMFKCYSNSGNWDMLDTSRNTYNLANARLLAENSTAEITGAGVDIVSNGFKIRNTDSSYNFNGQSYIYMAFAENPFKNALAR